MPIYLYGKFGFYYNTKRYTLYRRPFSNGDGKRNEAKQLLQSDLDNNSSTLGFRGRNDVDSTKEYAESLADRCRSRPTSEMSNAKLD